MRGEPGAWLFAAVFVVAFLFGGRSTRRLTRTYREVAPALQPPYGLILQAFVVVALVITVAAGLFGFFSIRRLAGFQPVDWQPLASLLIASAVLVLPRYLESVVARIASSARRQ